jgi:hypothetical protein
MRVLVAFICVCMVWSENTCYHQHGRVSLNQFVSQQVVCLFVIVLQFLIKIIIVNIIISLIDSYVEPHALHGTFTCHRPRTYYQREEWFGRMKLVWRSENWGMVQKYKILFKSTKKINFIVSNIPKLLKRKVHSITGGKCPATNLDTSLLHLNNNRPWTQRTQVGVMAAGRSEPILPSDWSEPTANGRSYGINIGFDVK